MSVSLARVNSHVEIRVSDTGCGIRPEILPHVFQRFVQGDATTTRSGGGLGLGLSIVRHLLELHGGTVTAHSEGEGKGSTFVVSLPLIAHVGVEAERDAPPAAAPEAFARPNLSGVTVLVVDDDPDARDMIARILELSGARVVRAGTAQEAWNLFRELRPTIVVSDIGMPVEDGYAFVRRLRQLPPEGGGTVPAVALTALASSDDRRRALQSGFQMHVVKPVDPGELTAVVASLTGRLRVLPEGPRA